MNMNAIEQFGRKIDLFVGDLMGQRKNQQGQESVISEQQQLARSAACFSRDWGLAYIVDSLGFMTREEVGRLAQGLYADTLANKPRPIGDVLREAGLTRESDRLKYLRSFGGLIDRFLVNTLRNPASHDVLMSHLALWYDQDEMEEVPDLTTPWVPGKPMFGMIDWLAGKGPVRPLMLGFYILHSLGYVNVQGNTGQEEIILPTFLTEFNISDLWEHHAHHLPLDSRNFLLVAGKYNTRILPGTS